MVEQTNAKLDKLRALMKEQDLAAFICFHMDQHNSEYIAGCDERIAYISGFSGSNGCCVVTADHAKMWTDSRYYLAAAKQLEAGWEMEKMESANMWFDWVVETIKEGKVGIDFTQYPSASVAARKTLFEGKGLKLENVANLVDTVWGDDRPARPKNNVMILDIKYTGEETLSKYDRVAEKCDGKPLLVTTLDDIAWLLNLRGTDISYNPVFFSYLLFDPIEKSCNLYIDAEKVESVKEYLASIKVTVKSYDAIDEDLKAIAAKEGGKVNIHASTCNGHLTNLVGDASIVCKDNPIQHIKAAKNLTEQNGMKACNIRDCAAIMKYFAYLEKELKKPDHTVDEYTGQVYLGELRTKGDLHQGPSFDSISSIGANGAIIHYKPEADTAIRLNNNEIYLLDSGGQYLDGTTDITRTTHFDGDKPPTDFQREAYTRVLRGVLDLERIVWPAKSRIAGGDMDILARKNLWAAGLNYGHGTGHGVGSFLNVHEGPVGVSRGYAVEWVVGHAVSNEPGYYEDGEFGIRIENVQMVQDHPTIKNHLCWYNLTCAPYSRNLIDKKFLAPDEVNYLDKFHERCLEQLSPLLQDDADALDYVKRACAPL